MLFSLVFYKHVMNYGYEWLLFLKCSRIVKSCRIKALFPLFTCLYNLFVPVPGRNGFVLVLFTERWSHKSVNVAVTNGQHMCTVAHHHITKHNIYPCYEYQNFFLAIF